MQITEIEISYSEPTFPGGLTVDELQRIMLDMDWLDGAQVQAATKKCNNRCSGNKVKLAVPDIQVDFS